MGNQVYANKMEISCKAADGKSICAFPDVCMTPPQTPATPPGVPIPYPNTGMASDCTDGSSSVQISGQEVMLKDSSYFKKSTGDEAGSAPMKGVMTSTNTGKVYFTMWSMDVQVEGENVVRNLDMTTHNHASMPSNTVCWPYIDEMSVFLQDGPCGGAVSQERESCAGCDPHGPGDPCSKPGCVQARKCMLVPHDPKRCCPDAAGNKCQPHHLVETHCFIGAGGRGANEVLAGFEGYHQHDAPCVCATGGAKDVLEHGQLHAVQQRIEAAHNNAPGSSRTFVGWEESGRSGGVGESNWNYGQARDAGVMSASIVFPHCDSECIKAQLDNYHKQAEPDGPGVGDNTPLRSDTSPAVNTQGWAELQANNPQAAQSVQNFASSIQNTTAF